MPPKAVKTIRDLIYWEYAKLISGSTVGDRRNYQFVMYCFQKLKNCKMSPSSITKENKMFCENPSICAYCGAVGILQWEHIIPVSKGGPNTIDNMVKACPECNQRKAGRDPFEWFGLERRYEIPRLVLGKYLKLVYEMHEKNGTLDSQDLNADGKLDVYDLGRVVTKL